MGQLSEKVNKTLRTAEQQGSWAAYAVYVLGEADTGDDELDEALAELYEANERVHRRGNQLALQHEIDFFEGS